MANFDTLSMLSTSASTNDELMAIKHASERCSIGVLTLAWPESRTPVQRLWRRREEYAAGRTLAAQLLSELGAVDTLVLSAEDGSPSWPPGYVGSISHTDQLAVVAVSAASRVRSVGVDLERIVADDVAAEVQSLCLGAKERELLTATDMNRELFATLCFSAKEAVYKCLYPLVWRFFDFDDVAIVELDVQARTIRANLCTNLGVQFPRGSELQGTYRCVADHVFTMFELPT